MKQLNVQISPVLDILVKKLSIISPEEEIETIPTFRKSFGGPTWDFAGYREYSPSDDASLIDWKASVRSNRILVKEFTEIQILNVFFLLDVGSSMMLGTTGKSKVDYASEMIATLTYSILKSKGNVRLAIFSDSLKKFMISVNDVSQFYQIKETLSNEETIGGKSSLEKVSKLIASNISKGSLVIIVSDFLNLGNNWKEKIKLLGSQTNLISFMIRDPIDISLPKGVNKVFIESPYSEERLLFNVRKYKSEYEKRSKEQEIELQNILNSVNAELLVFNTSQPYLGNLINFLERRKRKFH